MKKRPPRITGGPSVARLEQREHFFLGQWPVNDAIVLQLARNQSDDVFQLVTRHAGIPQARGNVELRDEPSVRSAHSSAASFGFAGSKHTPNRACEAPIHPLRAMRSNDRATSRYSYSDQPFSILRWVVTLATGDGAIRGSLATTGNASRFGGRSSWIGCAVHPGCLAACRRLRS